MTKRVIVIGAGPAGLTAAYELLKLRNGYQVTVFEESDCFGGISKTVNYKGNRMDMGGHRFFSKVPEVNAWWSEMLPMQGQPSWDDKTLEREVPLEQGGPDPNSTDIVMLTRHRISRIFFEDKFYDYPISLKLQTFKNMGFANTIAVGASYVKSTLFKCPENNLENFYINRFGYKLYSMFFEYYTKNLWGRHPREIDASWGKQRVKGLSVIAVIKNAFEKLVNKRNRKVETSLIEQFKYPKLGPGQLWDVAANKITELGGTILKNAKVTRLNRDKFGRLSSVEYDTETGLQKEDGDIFISSMPIKDLIGGMNGVPNDIARIAAELPYRDYMTLGVLVPKLNLKNETKVRTIGNIVPDCWVYVQDRRVRLARFQIYNNWSPYMVKDLEHTVWVGLEYFVNEGDDLWTMNEEEFSRIGIEEMIKIGLISSKDEVLDIHMEKVKKAYPAYFDSYAEISKVIDYLSSIENLYCVGRNGQHRYNNIDHSMCTSFEAVKNIVSGRVDKSNVWNVNTEQEYHEEGSNNDFYMNHAKKVSSYLIVGACATLVEWGCYWLFSNVLGIQYIYATVMAIVISTFSNWLFGRVLTFRNAKKQNLFKEIGGIYAVSFVGLVMNVILMWLLHGLLGMWDMLAKILATGIVFAYNYTMRVAIIYKNKASD